MDGSCQWVGDHTRRHIAERGPYQGLRKRRLIHASRLLGCCDHRCTRRLGISWVSPYDRRTKHIVSDVSHDRIIDVHSHIGVESSPHLISDGNSFKGLIVPWLRALDALNTHDDGMQLAVSGGVTTSLILPGSANAIGEQVLVRHVSTGEFNFVYLQVVRGL